MIRTIQIIPNFPELEKYYTFDKKKRHAIPLHYYDYDEEYCFHTQYFNIESLDEFTKEYYRLTIKYKLDEHLIELLFLIILQYGNTMMEKEMLTSRFSRYPNPAQLRHATFEDHYNHDITLLSRDLARFLLYFKKYNKPTDNKSRIHQIKFNSFAGDDFTVENSALIEIIISAVEGKLKNWNEPMYKYGEEFLINFLSTDKGAGTVHAEPEFLNTLSKKANEDISTMISNRLQTEFINYILHYFKNVKTELPMIKPNGKPTKEAKNFFLELLSALGFTEKDSTTKDFDNLFLRYDKSWRNKLYPPHELRLVPSE